MNDSTFIFNVTRNHLHAHEDSGAAVTPFTRRGDGAGDGGLTTVLSPETVLAEGARWQGDRLADSNPSLLNQIMGNETQHVPESQRTLARWGRLRTQIGTPKQEKCSYPFRDGKKPWPESSVAVSTFESPHTLNTMS